ncbi:MAG: glycosyltransferase family 2 protein [Chloroflexi bacterium]|nr:glycosyltransferase family 2 protein [Chloroflexota bacterium]
MHPLIWKAQTVLHKRLIAWQERLGGYTYQDWIRENEPRSLPPEPPRPPSLSLLWLPLGGDGQEAALRRRTLDSLAAQGYPHWREAPAGLASMDGEYFLALYPGDTLAPDALRQAAPRLAAAPPPDILYCDEDALAEDGLTRYKPFFKPDWSPELLLSVSYLQRGFFRAALFQKLAAQHPAEALHELVFRAVEAGARVEHLPLPLLHRGSGGISPQEHCAAAQAHLLRLGLAQAQCRLTPQGEARAAWQPSGGLVSIIIPTKDNAALLRCCLASLIEVSDYPAFEILLVDSGSVEVETAQLYEELQWDERIRIVEFNAPFNFSAALNLGAGQARGGVYVFLNNDTVITQPGWLAELARWSERPEVGVVGAKLLYPDGRIQHAGVVFGLEGHASHVFGGAPQGVSGPFGSVEWYRNYSAVTAACVAMRREVFEALGGFDERYQLVFSDIEIGLRAAARGWRVVYTPYASLLHLEGRSRAQTMPYPDLERGLAHFRAIVARGDPYFNPNLSHTVRLPTLRRRFEQPPLARLERIVASSHD